MQSNRGKTNYTEDCQKDYQRQQERLKAMSTTPDKHNRPRKKANLRLTECNLVMLHDIRAVKDTLKKYLDTRCFEYQDTLKKKGKTVSADLMIENLLKDPFKKPSHVSVPAERSDQFYSELPHWLQCESTAVPSVYKQLWSLVALTTEQADTQKVSQLLLSSGLQVDVLGFIWNLANKMIPGQLTKQEFYIVLALVGLAQTGSTFNSLNVLKHIPLPPIPILQGSILTHTAFQTYVPQNTSSYDSFQHIPIQEIKRDSVSQENRFMKDINLCNVKQSAVNLSENTALHVISGRINNSNGVNSQSINISNEQEIQINKGPSKNSNFPYIGSSPTSELEDDFSEFQSVPAVINESNENMINPRSDSIADDFTDFQSAIVENLDPFKAIVVKQTREIPKILLPKSFSEKFTNLKSNIIKISPESERKLKILSTTESISSLPESKISSTNKVSTSISVLGGSRGISSRQTNHSFSSKADNEKCHKHQKHKATPASSFNSEEEIIFGVKPVYIENLMPKCHPKNSNNSKTFLLKETKIKNDDILESSSNDESACNLKFAAASSKENTRQIEIPMLGTLNETVLPTQKKLTSSSTDLISVQEDKYSALREMDLVLNQENNDSKEKNDEFGDFLSANIPPSAPVKTDPLSISTSSLLLECDETKSWEDWNFNSQLQLNIGALTNNVLDEPNSNSVIKEEADLFDKFTSLSFTEKSECAKHVSPSRPVEQQDIFSMSERNSHLKNSNKDIVFCDQSEKNNPGYQPKSDQFNSQQDPEFWDFLSSEVKAPNEVPLSRQGSLPSLDLKISTVDETDQEVIWRKCLESCHNLIQDGFEKFNCIRVKSVLDEVFSATKTAHYLNCLYIVYQISKRISQNFSDLPSVQEELEKFWGRLQELCFEYNIKLTPSVDDASEGTSQCCICLKHIVCDLITRGTYSYHPSCANLWINFVESTLPFSTLTTNIHL